MESENRQVSRVAKVFRVVGYVTALLTLAFGISRAWIAVADHRTRQNQVSELLATAEVQLIGSDYSSAWNTVGEAETVAPSALVRERLEDIAMAWLRDFRVPEGETFDQAVSPLIPVVTRGVTLSDDGRRADLLAHVGWSYFLRYRTTGFDSDFERYYEEALAIDPGNPFANAFAGHWALWRGDSPEEAARYFESGLQSGRESRFVRRLQMAGLANFSSLEHAAALVRMGVDMRAGGEPPPDAFVPTLWRTAYQLVMANGNDRQRDLMLEAAPPGDHLAMFNAFFDPQSAPYRDNRWERDLWLAYIMDRAGESGRAAALLGETPRTTDSGSPLNPAYVAEIEEAMARFSGSTAR